MADSFHFKIPASTANLGPGFGLLGLALDRVFEITIEIKETGGLVVERPDSEQASSLDLRHDSILRGLRASAERFDIELPEHLVVTITGDVPRGCGLGTNSADFAAGLCSAMRFAKVQPSIHDLIGLSVEIGSDPAHGAAAICGGLVIAVPFSASDQPQRFRLLPHPIHETWQFSLVAPQLQIGTADVHRVVPPSLPIAVTQRTAGRLTGLLRALADADEELLRLCLVDEVHVPFRQQLTEGMTEAMASAMEAGAAGVTISGHGPALLAMSTDPNKTEAAAVAMAAAFRAAGAEVETLLCRPWMGSPLPDAEPG